MGGGLWAHATRHLGVALPPHSADRIPAQTNPKGNVRAIRR